MPALHESVILCNRCDLIVAECETGHCEECRQPICPGCRKTTASDPDVYVCSERCRAHFDMRQRKARQEQKRAAQEAADWLLQQQTPGGIQ